jgi:hypothetical protein
MKKTHLTILALLVPALIFGCGSRENTASVVVLSVGDVQVKNPGKEFAPARAARVILKGDIIKTGPRSHVTIQVGDLGMVQIAPESTVEATSLLESLDGALYLSKGTVSSRIERLGKWRGYSVKTPTAIAAVRGTVFSVSYAGAASTVGVSRGRVRVTETSSGKAELVEKGKAADVDEGITLRDLGGIESLVMEKVAAVPFVENAGKAAPEAIEEKGRSALPDIERIDRKLEEAAPATLEGIRARYGRIDEVTLYSGRVFRGAIVSRGESLTIIIPGGTVRVPARSVRQTVSL